MKKETFAFDLDEIFVRVSQTYFGGKIARPKLAWSARGAKYTMGKYNYTTDTLTINRRLNRADTPEYVLEFVMYHELLHKALGYSVVNNRRRVHSPQFRKLEKAFARYREASDFLEAFARKSVPRPSGEKNAACRNASERPAQLKSASRSPYRRGKGFLEWLFDLIENM